MKNKLNQSNPLVFITGASSGIGRACAVEFAKRGHPLIITARRYDRLSELAQSLQNEYHVDVLPLVLDVTDRAAVNALVQDLPEAFKQPQILINNAGLALSLSPIETQDPADWEAMIDTNIKGVLYMTRALLPLMLTQPHGHIINIGSVSSYEVYANGSVYCATKHALRALTTGLRMELVHTAIKVTTISPGLVNTEFSGVRFKGDQARADKVYEGMTPLSAEDVADAIVYAATRPAHVNIGEMIVLPSAQASGSVVHRKS